MECHVQDTAQIIADSGVDANWAVVVARFVAMHDKRKEKVAGNAEAAAH